MEVKGVRGSLGEGVLGAKQSSSPLQSSAGLRGCSRPGAGPGVEVFLEARDGALPLTLVQGLSRGRGQHWQGAATQEVSWLFSHQGWLLLGL